MAFLIPEAVIEVAEAIGITAAAVGAVALTYEGLKSVLAELDSSKTVAEADDKLKSWADGLVSISMTAADFTEINLANALHDAYARGELLPSETSAAVQWIMKVDKLSVFSGTYIVEGRFAASLAVWAVHQGHTVNDTGAEPLAATKAVVYTGASGEGVNTEGGVVVAGAQASVLPERIVIPGMSTATAAGISVALADTYKNAITTMVGTANELIAQIRQVAGTAASASGMADEAYKDAAALEKKLAATVADLNADITHDGQVINQLQTKVDTQAKAIQNLTNQVDALALPIPSADSIPGIVDEITAVVGGMGLAGLLGIDSLRGLVDDIGAEVAAETSVLDGIGAIGFVGTLEDLLQCCDAAHLVTDPIAAAGGSAALLAELGPILLEAGVSAVGVSVVSTILTILDLPAAIAGDVKGASFAATYVDAIVADTVSLIESGGILGALAA
jgi:hypothetical protein